MRLPGTIGLVMLPTLAAPPAAAQHHEVAATANSVDFLVRARDGTAAYQDRARAIADGFRPLGADAPSMGQHWVHTGRILGGVLDAGRPAGLTYIMVGDRPMLTGVIYILPLDQGTQATEEPAGRNAWHFHNGDLSEEALLSVHDPVHGHDAPGLRIAVLHAWVWVENPDGPFAPENWSLPYKRVGVPPQDATSRAAKALSIATAEGRSFFTSRVRLAAGRAVLDVDPVLLTHGERIRAWLTELAGPGLTNADIRWLEESWDGVVRDLLAIVATTDRDLMRRVFDGPAP